ncbi:hypothetical protein RE428_15290 [Marinobacter nanhaiticus D15-8W]|uniref:Uncharacterized protein n=1 Tax=Marinobacter nanhaiticus D15-8W TaxID=626887 RepID=N6WNQ5_9GAMM|nr:hypothetical protein [Marinobacter nanhaiticus]ENO13151.1 hypothetical protein J057_17185 [Marinobacter nanhaiticus D15-8W]BES70511.1 hypothetical protein RE428_15290 [Marinobacter nanhaiticus D15-8W]
MDTIPNFPSILSRFRGHRIPGLVVGLTAVWLLSACSLQPTPPLSLDTGAQPIPASAETFHTDVRPAPGRFRFLQKVERAVITQLEALGYEKVERGSGDFSVLIQLSRTDRVIPFVEPVESGRLNLYMMDDDETLRVGRSPNLDSIDLDFMQEQDIAERVRMFLDGIPARTKNSS